MQRPTEQSSSRHFSPPSTIFSSLQCIPKIDFRFSKKNKVTTFCTRWDQSPLSSKHFVTSLSIDSIPKKEVFHIKYLNLENVQLIYMQFVQPDFTVYIQLHVCQSVQTEAAVKQLKQQYLIANRSQLTSKCNILHQDRFCSFSSQFSLGTWQTVKF